MCDIISIDKEKKSVRVEPSVTIGKLNDFLNGQGWTLPIVPELDDLTIGGLVMGGGIESTSHKYGLFQFICQAYELVLGDGSVVWCSPTEKPDLFLAIPFSYGTIGFLTCVDLDIVPYKPFLKLTYHNVKTLDKAVDKFKEVTNDPKVDSVEGIMYTLNTGVIMSGEFVDRVPSTAKYNPLDRWYQKWFFKHVEEYMDEETQRNGNVEYVPTKGFYHRHNKAFFWLMSAGLPFANNVLFRYLFGWTMPIKLSLLKILGQMMTPPEEERTEHLVVQDLIFNLDDLKEALTFIDQQTEIYPIWLCPARHKVWPGLEEMSPYGPNDVHVDVGIYGFPPIKGYKFAETQRNLEQFTIAHGGLVALYAETELTLEDFTKMFGPYLKHYDLARIKYKCQNAFPHVYEKISKLGRS